MAKRELSAKRGRHGSNTSSSSRRGSNAGAGPTSPRGSTSKPDKIDMSILDSMLERIEFSRDEARTKLLEETQRSVPGGIYLKHKLGERFVI